MKRILMGILVIVSVVIVALLLPLLFKDRSRPPLVGPDLSELEFTEVFFRNHDADLLLSGMLFQPDGEGPFPAVVIIHGSGTSRRNSKWYLSVTQHLIQNGIAVLLPDKRGSEKSEGEWLGSSYEELATDTLSAIDFVMNQEMFEVTSIGILGMSQGGSIAPIVAAETDSISFVVSMVGPVVTPEEQLLHEEIYNINPYTYKFLAKLIAPHTSRALMKKEFFKPTAGFDPVPYWKEVEVPVFFAFGGGDENVPNKASIDRLKDNDLEHHLVKEYAHGGHAIRDRETNTVSAEFLGDLVGFVRDSE